MFRSPQSLALLPQWVTAPLLRALHSSMLPSLPCHMGGQILHCPKLGAFYGHRACSSAGKNPTASALLLLLHSTQHAMPRPSSPQKMWPFLDSIGLKIFCKGYHNPHPTEIKMEPEESKVACSSFKNKAASELGNETSWPTTLGFSFLNKDSLSSLKN